MPRPNCIKLGRISKTYMCHSANQCHGQNIVYEYEYVSRAISGTDSLEVPTVYKAYFSGLNFREYPYKIRPEIWY